MLTPANQFLRHVRVLDVTGVRVSVAHAATADADVFDRIKIL